MLNIDNNVLFIFTFRNIFIKHAKENIFVSSSRKLISLSSFSLSSLSLLPLSLSRSYPRGCLSSSFSTVWSTYSNTRWSLFFLLNTSIKLTKFGCFSCCKVMKYHDYIRICLQRTVLYHPMAHLSIFQCIK